ncbi:MAG TPA: hypothetical protein GXX49_08415 [Clostridiaceae bacterium]|nr:hypothetical protein [Clostridiaceae bacterium]
MLKMIYLGGKSSRMPADGPFIDALRELGELTLIPDATHISESERAEMIRQNDIVLTMWGALPVPEEIADNPGRLRYCCHITGELRRYIPKKIIESENIYVTNWGDAPANNVAEGAVSLLLAVLKDLHMRVANVRRDEWGDSDPRYASGTLEGLNVGLYGFGVIGRRFAEILHVFGAKQYVFDPYVKELPDYCTKVETLRELFEKSEAIAIHAGLSDETRGSVNAELLALLPDNGIIINTARGDIIDQDALFAELEKGRLRAGLDVLAVNDRLPEGHPARKWENLILTCHQVSKIGWPEKPWELKKYEKICLDNIKRFINGEPLKFIMDIVRYERST